MLQVELPAQRQHNSRSGQKQLDGARINMLCVPHTKLWCSLAAVCCCCCCCCFFRCVCCPPPLTWQLWLQALLLDMFSCRRLSSTPATDDALCGACPRLVLPL